jgi:dTMP kinase
VSRPLFLTLEGTEGVGKSTNLQFICDRLSALGIDFVRTREPGGTPLAEEIRELLLRSRDERVDPAAELLMIFAARAQHLREVVLPALARGQWVVCDRFTDATFAYQGGGRGMDTGMISALEHMVQGDVRPDAVIILDVDPSIGLARARGRGVADRFESEDLAFFTRVRDMYHTRANARPDTYHLIDAGRSLEDVQVSLATLIDRLVRGAGS